MKPSTSIRQRKRTGRSTANNGNQELKNAESGIAGTSTTNEHTDNQLIDGTQIDLANSLATKLSLDNDDHHAGPTSNQSCQTLLATGLQNLTLQPGQLQSHTGDTRQRQHLRQTESYDNGERDVAKVNNEGVDTDNNNNNYTSDKHATEIRRRKKGEGGRQFLAHWRHLIGAKSADSACDGDERSDNGQQDEDEDTDSELDCDRLSEGGLQADTSSCCSTGDSDCTIHSDNYPNSTGYNADESLSPHYIDSDDKSSSTTKSLHRPSTTTRAILRHPRMRLATTTTSSGVNLARDVIDKLESGSERESSCSCRGVQDHHEKCRNQKLAGNDGGCNLPTQLGGKSEKVNHNNTHDKDNSYDCKACRCAFFDRTRDHPLRAHTFGVSSQQRHYPPVSARCSDDSSGWLSLFRWLPAYLQPLFVISNDRHNQQHQSTPSQVKRRKTRRQSAVELKPYRSASSKSSSERTSNDLPKTAEWQQQRSTITIGGDQERSIKMPNNNSNYGSGTRYQSLPSASGASRRASGGSMSRNRQRVSVRLYESNGYLRLGNSYHQKTPPEHSRVQELKRILLLLIIVAICGLVLWQIYEILVEETNYLGTVKFSPSELGHFNHYAVSTDAEPCAKIGKNLLAKGGHAVDAALGTLICMGIALPNSLGLGGGCLMTIYDNGTKQATVIDGREIAPDYATETMFAHNPLSASRGPLSIGVPGELAAYWEAHKLFGKLPWPMLFEESIKMAEEGFPTVEHLSSAFRDMTHAKYIHPELREIFTNNATGDYFREGEIMRLPQLAKTLRRISDNGVSEFYDGQTGQQFIEDLKRLGGKMTMDNLRKYKALVKPAAVIKLDDDLTVYTQPIPGSGLVLSIILRILKELGYYKNLRPRYSFESSALYYHHLAEALKFAYAQRAGLEDQPDDPARMERLIVNITSEQFIKNAVKKIINSRTQPSEVYGGLEYFQADHGTAHTSVIDREGNSVAITTSVNLYFGSGLVSPRTGIIYNDVMDDFTSANITNKFALPPSKYNRIRPGKRPISSMAPSVFVDSRGNPKLLVGASGGSKITSAIATVALRNLFFDEDLKTAIDGPRIHHQFLPDQVSYEANFAPELQASLKARGHHLQVITGRSSVVMGIACNYTSSGLKHITANSDYRKGGSVAGL